MVYQTIILERRNQTAWIYLNRPDDMNSISITLLRELSAVLREVEQDDSVRVLKNHTRSYDFNEGLAVFAEKRKPNFKGF